MVYCGNDCYAGSVHQSTLEACWLLVGVATSDQHCAMIRAGPIKSSYRSTSAANVGSRSPGKTHAEKIGFAALLVSLL